MNRNISGIGNDGNKPERLVFLTLKKGEIYQCKISKYIFFLFLQKGEGKLKMQERKPTFMNEKSGILIDNKMEFQAESQCSLIVWLLNNKFTPEDRAFFRILQPLATNYPYSGKPIAICSAIEKFLELLYTYKKDNLMEQDILYELKQQELFLLFRHYYDTEKLYTLFYPFLCRLNDFQIRVLACCDEVTNCRELISRLGMRRTTFEQKFRQHFGTSAHQWLLQRKAEKVYQSLQEEHYSLREIRKLHRFNSSADFVRFSRRWFGAPPTQVRKQTRQKATGNSHTF